LTLGGRLYQAFTHARYRQRFPAFVERSLTLFRVARLAKPDRRIDQTDQNRQPFEGRERMGDQRSGSRSLPDWSS
jgi:hypothetical protein